MLNNVLNYFDHPKNGNDNALNINGSFYSSFVAKTLIATATLAEINIGKVLLIGELGKTITILDFKAKVAGNFATVTSVEIEDTDSSPVAIASTAAAGLTDGAILNEVEANTTMGAGYLGDLTSGKGVQITKTGSDATAGTSVTIRIVYTVS